MGSLGHFGSPNGILGVPELAFGVPWTIFGGPRGYFGVKKIWGSLRVNVGVPYCPFWGPWRPFLLELHTHSVFD